MATRWLYLCLLIFDIVGEACKSELITSIARFLTFEIIAGGHTTSLVHDVNLIFAFKFFGRVGSIA